MASVLDPIAANVAMSRLDNFAYAIVVHFVDDLNIGHVGSILDNCEPLVVTLDGQPLHLLILLVLLFRRKSQSASVMILALRSVVLFAELPAREIPATV